MKVTSTLPTPPDEIKIILSREEAYAIMAVCGRVSGTVTYGGELTTRGICSELYKKLGQLGFDTYKKDLIKGNLQWVKPDPEDIDD